MLERPYVIYLRLKNAATPEVFETTRLPSTNETLEDWLNAMIVTLDEDLDPTSGLLYIDHEEVAAISFRRKTDQELGAVRRLPQ